jgi:crotonobetainyl-CoA:carnitine CoA-transferase CaiB-like acyl-CoA transferase
VLSEKKPGLIHAKVVLHGERGPWSNRVGFDEICSPPKYRWAHIKV